MDYLWLTGDISSSSDRERVVTEAFKEFGRIDVLVNNAGVAPKLRADLLTMTEESYDYVMDTNTKANMFITQRVAREMTAQEPVEGERDIIINISSCSAEVSSVNRANTASPKRESLC